MLPRILRNFIKSCSRSFSYFYSRSAFVPTLKQVSPRNVVFITGCDSGFGYNLALLCHSLNMTVVIGCQNINSDGAKLLQSLPDSKRIVAVEIDIRNSQSIVHARKIVSDLTSQDDREFTALVNNAGIMCFGEFEWQTESLFESQIDTNTLGPMRVTKEFLPLVRKHRSRIINVTSHCGLQALPGLSAYAASKAALLFWTDAIRMELKQYSIKVVNFIPGSFVAYSNIAGKQQQFAEEMWNGFDDEQKEFYGEYFKRYNSFLEILSGNKRPMKIDDKKLFHKFKLALLSEKPQDIYKHEPFRYTFYHFIFKIAPTPVRDYFVSKFVNLPSYHQPK